MSPTRTTRRIPALSSEISDWATAREHERSSTFEHLVAWLSSTLHLCHLTSDRLDIYIYACLPSFMPVRRRLFSTVVLTLILIFAVSVLCSRWYE